jgi:DNA-binding NtrC family response regulator
VAATNKDLEQEMEAGRFRRDLFYRLNVIPIHIPPLRERSEDIGPLAEFLLTKHAGSEGPRRLSPAALARLVSLPWEGNARELENVIERALALCDRPVIEPEDLPVGDGSAVADADDPRLLLRGAVEQRLTLHELGDLYIEQILKETGGNKVRAAHILGINRRTLYRRGERTRSREAAARELS